MTFNIRYDNPEDNDNWWEHRKLSILKMFNFYSPEIIGIQEGLNHQVKCKLCVTASEVKL